MLGERLAGRTLAQRTIPLSLSSARRLLPEVLEYDQKTRFVGEFMTKVDGGAMHFALEARSPFLDHEIWEFAAALSFRLRLRGGTLKAVLREMVRRRVGAAVAARPKRGFTVPVERWLLGRWKESLEDLARDSRLEKEGWIRRGKVRASVEEAIQSAAAPTQLWHMLVLEHWLRAHALN
jgi:asparagine synthase (glutamine-hydrolysing)